MSISQITLAHKVGRGKYVDVAGTEELLAMNRLGTPQNALHEMAIQSDKFRPLEVQHENKTGDSTIAS